MCYYVIINTINKKTIKFMAILSKKERHFMNTKLRKYTRIYLFLAIILLLLARMHFFNVGFAADQKKVSALGGKMCTLTLKVKSIPKRTNDAVSFNAEVQDGIDISSMLRVRIKNGERLGITCGDTVKLICEPQIADGAMNKGCFDYNGYLKSQGVCAAAYSGIEYIKDIENGKMHAFYAKRSMLTEKIFKYLPYDEASLVNALVTGSKDEMSNDIKEMFRRSGTYHVVAVSGLHLNILVLLLSYLYSKLNLPRRAKVALMIGVNLFAAAFVFIFTGFGMSIARAALMSAVLCLSILAMREYSAPTALFTVLITLLFIKPYAILDTSMQLSFSATAGILFGVRLVQRYKFGKYKFAALAESCVITFFAWLFTLPITAITFQSVSLVTLASNLAILAFMPMLMCFSYIFALVCMFAPPFLCNAVSCFAAVPASAVLLIAKAFSSIPWASVDISVKDMTVLTLNAVFAVSAVIAALSKRRRTAVAIILVMAVANFSNLAYNNKECNVNFLNVGQGDCCVIEAPDGGNLMIDCGSESMENAAEYAVIPYLVRKGIYKIDTAVISHWHSDHTNAIIPLIERGMIRSLAVPDRLCSDDERDTAHEILSSAIAHKVKISFVSKGDKIKFGKYITLSVLSPQKQWQTDANENSLVVMARIYGKRLLFTGDIGANTQYILSGGDIKADILKIPHHGGKSLVSERFANAVNPKYAVVSCGVDNKYSHPAPETLKAYRNAEIMRTDTDKTIEFKINKTGEIYAKN